MAFPTDREKFKYHPPAVRRAVKLDYITGRFASLSECARAHDVPPDTVRCWSLKERWKLLRDNYQSHADKNIVSTAKADVANGKALDGAITHVGALCVQVTDASELEKLCRALQTLEFTQFAVIHGHLPSATKPVMSEKPDQPGKPQRRKTREKEPVAKVEESPPEPKWLNDNGADT